MTGLSEFCRCTTKSYKWPHKDELAAHTSHQSNTVDGVPKSFFWTSVSSCGSFVNFTTDLTQELSAAQILLVAQRFSRCLPPPDWPVKHPVEDTAATAPFSEPPLILSFSLLEPFWCIIINCDQWHVCIVSVALQMTVFNTIKKFKHLADFECCRIRKPSP